MRNYCILSVKVIINWKGKDMLYQVTLRQTFFGQECLNQWHYNSADVVGAVSGSFGLLSAMGFIESAGVYPADGLFAALRAVQSDELDYVEVECAALYSPTDFYTLPFNPTPSGARTGAANTPVLSYGFSTNRVRRDVRRGQKRLTGTVEADVDAGGVVASAVLTLLNTVATRMSAVLTYVDEETTFTYTPVVLSYEMYTEPPDKPAYRPYPTLAEQLTHMASGVSWAAKPIVRTQVSRQYGRGR